MLLEYLAKTSNTNPSAMITLDMLRNHCLFARVDVVRHIVENHQARVCDLVMEESPDDGSTVMHLVAHKDIAALLLGSMSVSQKTVVLTAVNASGMTPLHVACQCKRKEIMQLILEATTKLNIISKVILHEDRDGWSCLHYSDSDEMTVELLGMLSEQERMECFMVRRAKGRTLLHSVVYDTKLASLMCVILSSTNIDSLISGEVIHEILTIEDHDKNLPLMLAVHKGNMDAIQMILEYVDELGTEELFKAILEHRNINQQNVYHLAQMHPECDELMDMLIEHSHLADPTTINIPDKFGNIPLVYLASRFKTKTFAGLVMKLPLAFRLALLEARNISGTSCVAVLKQKDFDRQFFYNSVLCGNHRIRLTDGEQAVTLRSEEGEHTYLFTNFLDAIYDEQIWKVMRYAFAY